MKSSKRGTSLLEMIIGTGLFLLCFSLVFVLFHKGRSTLTSVDNAGNLQSSLLQLKLHLQGDLHKTALDSISVRESQLVAGRDDFCCVSLDDWSQPANFDSGTPRWTHRVTYVNGLDEENGLQRVVSIPDDPNHLRAIPVSEIWPLPNSDEIVGQRQIVSDVSAFKINVDWDDSLVEVESSLRRGKGKSVSGNFTIFPRFTRDFIKNL